LEAESEVNGGDAAAAHCDVSGIPETWQFRRI